MFKLGIIAATIRRGLAFLLDAYPNAAAAYSLRKLRTAYTGSAIRVRRSTDNTEQDIGFDTSGNLDEAALAAFVGNGNAFTYSEQFDNAIWVKDATSATANQTTAPDGTTTADLISESATNTRHQVYFGTNIRFIAGRYYTVSCYLKKGPGATAPDLIQMTHQAVAFGTGRYVNFNISTGTIVNQVGGTGTITSVGNGWYRCTYTDIAANSVSTLENCIIFINNNNSSGYVPVYIGLVTSDVYAWGAQLNEGSTAQTYTPTTANQAGFGYVTKWYDQSGTPINQFLYSEQFQQSSWIKENSTATADQTTAPDGTNTADLIAESAVTNRHGVYQNGTHVNGTTYTLSTYLKKGGGATAPDIIALRFSSQSFSGAYANFNISTGSVTLTSGCTATITSAGSGWYRCSITATATLSGTNANYALVFTNNNPSSGGLPSYLGVITSNVFIWGAQLVEGSLPLTYTKTEAAISNRDVVQTTAANQPQVMSAGQVQKDGGKVTVYYTGSNNLILPSSQYVFNFIHNGTKSALSLVANSISTTGTLSLIGNAGSSSGQVGFELRNNQLRVFRGVSGTNAAQINSIPYFGRYLYYTAFDVGNATANQRIILNANNSTINNNTDTSSPSINNASLVFMIGGSTGSSFIGYIQELVVYPTDQTSNSTGIRSNVNTYYTIY